MIRAIQDSIGDNYCDELTGYLMKVRNEPQFFGLPQHDAQAFVEGVTGLVLRRDGPFQVQLFICHPGTVIPEHCHPNVDSYEVGLRGMELRVRGRRVLPMRMAKLTDGAGLPVTLGTFIRVKAGDLHSATAGEDGGAFLSVQHWLNGIKPTSVGNDWAGPTMGARHDSDIQKVIHG